MIDDFIRLSIEQNINKAIHTLGIERTLETIEGIANPILRGKLRMEYFKQIKGGKV